MRNHSKSPMSFMKEMRHMDYMKKEELRMVTIRYMTKLTVVLFEEKLSRVRYRDIS